MKDLTEKLLICGETCQRLKPTKSSRHYECFAGSGQGATVMLGRPCVWGFDRSFLHLSGQKGSSIGPCPYLSSRSQSEGCLIRYTDNNRQEISPCDFPSAEYALCPRYFHKVLEITETEPFHDRILQKLKKPIFTAEDLE